jgi:hypothetical protein
MYAYAQHSRPLSMEGSLPYHMYENICFSSIEAWAAKLAKEEDIKTQLRNKEYTVLNILDFAGQGAYYASHQTYIRQDAIYIIVFNSSKNLDEKGKEEKEEEKFLTRPPDSIFHLCDRDKASFSYWTQKGKCHF